MQAFVFRNQLGADPLLDLLGAEGISRIDCAYDLHEFGVQPTLQGLVVLVARLTSKPLPRDTVEQTAYADLLSARGMLQTLLEILN